MKHKTAAFCTFLVIAIGVVLVWTPPQSSSSLEGETAAEEGSAQFGAGMTGVSLLRPTSANKESGGAYPFTVAEQDLAPIVESMQVLLDKSRYEPNVILASVPDGMGVDEVKARLTQIQGIELESLDLVVKGVVRVTAKGASDTLARRMALVSCADFVQSVQPSYFYKRNDEAAGDDPEQSAEGEAAAAAEAARAAEALSNDTYASLQWSLQAANVSGAWDAGITGEGVTVAVIDAGFDVDHPDLADKFVGAYNVVDGSSNVAGGAHGLEVSGVVSAIRNNGYATSGVAPDARVVPIMAAEQGEYTTVSLLKAYDYILRVRDEYNIRAINTSFGFDWSGTSTGDPLMYKMIDRAYAAGVVSVASAGNAGRALCHCPCDYTNVVGVMGLEYAGFDQGTYAGFDKKNVVRSGSSNYNGAGETHKNIAAPGFGVPNIANQDRDDKITQSWGTSFAAPHVAATVALMFQANPGITSAQVMSALYSSAVDTGDVGWDAYYGYGMLDAGEAVRFARDGHWLKGPAFLPVGEPSRYETGNGEELVDLQGAGDVAQVSCEDGMGVVVPTRAGTMQLSATTSSGLELRAEVNAVGPLEGPDQIVFGGAGTFAVAQPYAFSYRWSTRGGVVDATGETFSFSPGEVGTYTVSAALVGDPSVRLSRTVEVVPANLEDASVAAIAPQAYTGHVVVPKPVVTLGGRILAWGSDYTVSYANNVEPGTATLTITGKGNYKGSVVATFQIER